MKAARIFFGALVCAAACSTPQQPAGPDAATAGDVVRIPVTVHTDSGEVVFQAEIADTDQERARGLMYRRSMGEREGMIFLFPREQQLSFWMKNCYIPLDLLFIKSDHSILGIVENALPETENSRAVPGQSQFVLEINGGLSAQLGIKAGQNVSFYAPVPPS